MAGPMTLRCPDCMSRELAVTARLHHHRVVMGRRQPFLSYAKSNEVRCTKCRRRWRSTSRLADALPDAEVQYRCCPGFSPEHLREARARR